MSRNRQNDPNKKSKVTVKLSHNMEKAHALACQKIQSELSKECVVSYTVDWDNFPNSLQLKVLCQTLDAEDDARILTIFQQSYLKVGIRFKRFVNNIEVREE